MLPQSSPVQWSYYSKHQYDVLTLPIIFSPAGWDKTSPILINHIKVFKPLYSEGEGVCPQHSWQRANVTQTLCLTSFWLRRCVRWSLASSCLCRYVPHPPADWILQTDESYGHSGPQHPPCLIPSLFTLFTFMSAAAWIKPVDHQQ